MEAEALETPRSALHRLRLACLPLSRHDSPFPVASPSLHSLHRWVLRGRPTCPDVSCPGIREFQGEGPYFEH